MFMIVCHDGFNYWKNKFNTSGGDIVIDFSGETYHICVDSLQIGNPPQAKVMVSALW